MIARRDNMLDGRWAFDLILVLVLFILTLIMLMDVKPFI